MNLERYARACGPAVLAAALGIPRVEAARRLAARKRRPRQRLATNVYTIGEELDLPVYNLRRHRVRGRWHYPTLARWLREDGRDAILRASHHFVLVRGGRVVESNGWEPRRGRVSHMILLTQHGA